MSKPSLDYDAALVAIRSLRWKQREVFGQICCNNDAGHHPATLQALERRGLICSRLETLPGRFPVRVKRYDVANYAVHMAWCQLCPEES